MMSGIDYIVPSRDVENIAAEVELLRPKIRIEFGFQTDVIGFLEGLKYAGIDRKEFGIILFDAPEGADLCDLVFVRANNDGIYLHCDNALLWDAKRGDPTARYMLAHEIGHLILHTNKFSERHFSRVKSGDTAIAEENKSEWQANQFAEIFLIAPAKRLTMMTVLQIAVKYGVPEFIAESARKRSILKFSPTGDV